MEAFFTRILYSVITSIITGKENATPEEAQAAVKGFITDAVKEATQDVSLALDNMDGKVGNLQEQITGIPGQIIQGILGPIQAMLKNPLGGLFGQH